MNLLVFRPENAEFSNADQRSGEVTVTGRQRDHLYMVHRAQPGETLRVGLLGGPMGNAVITAMDESRAQLMFTLDQSPPPPLPTILILALPRPKMLKRILQTIACMGVKTLYLINSFRVEKSFWQTPYLQADFIEEQLVLGLEQGKDTVLPEVHQRRLFKPFIEDELPTLLQGRRALLAHPGTDAIPCPRGITEPSLLAIGPEGGFIPYEAKRLTERGFTQVSLGERILRVDTAVPALLARLY